MKPLIQRFQTDHYDQPVFCPACGHKVVAYGEVEATVSPCPHTLFVAHDEGFEHRSPMFDDLMGIEGVDDEEIDVGEGGVDGFTDRVPLANSLKIASYVPPPSGFGAYVGFHFAEEIDE